MKAVTDLVRFCFTAYETKDRALIESLLAPDFTFSSPIDDHISRATYFERCWPNSEHLRAFRIEKLFAEGDEAFVTYEAESTDGSRFRNTEFFKAADGKIREVTVYFGSDLATDAEETEFHALMEATVKACRAKDAQALMACYAADVLAFDLLPPLRYHSTTELGERVQTWFDSFKGPIGYDLRDLKITTGPGAAFAHSLNHVTGTKTDGQKISMWWRATVGFSKASGHWLITHAHNSVPFDMNTGKALLDLEP